MRIETAEELTHVPINDEFLEQTIKMTSELNHKDAVELFKILQQNMDIFAWSTIDMLRVELDVITHKLNIDSKYCPIKWKKRNFILNRS